MKRLILFLAITSCYYSYSQSVNILIHDLGPFVFGGIGVYQDFVTDAYETAGFEVNLETAIIDNSLNTDNYDVLIVEEFGSLQWIFSISETQRVLVENFIINGGHVIWISESRQDIQHNANITINNVFGTNIVNGPFFTLIGGSSNVFRIHPSNGPGGLSPADTARSTGSYGSTLNVPNCNKIFTCFPNSDVTNFDPCLHTVISLFPSKPKPNQGSVILINEVLIPFKTLSGTISRTEEFNNAIAQLHYHLLVDQDLSFNEWTDDPNNLNSDCPPPSTNFSYSDTKVCIGDTIIISSQTDSTMFILNSPGVHSLTANFQSGLCNDDTTIIVEVLNTIAQVPNDTSICLGESYVFNVFNNQYTNATWNNGVINNQEYYPTEEMYYTLTVENNGCIGKDSLKIDISPDVNADFDYTFEPYSSTELKGDFKNNSTKGESIKYYWSFEKEINTSDDFEPSYIFDVNEEIVDISLLVTNQHGCNDSVTKSILLNPDLLDVFQVPNAFTPNDDQTNDIFKPVLNAVPRKYEFTIYNKWGKQIFKTYDFNEGWDGTYKDNIVPLGVYVLKLLINKKVYTQSFTIMGAN